MKVIFLDIDGVLNIIPQGRDQYGAVFHPHLVENLKTVIDSTGAKIVISSTWRMSGLSVMQEMWSVRNLPGEVIAVTPNHMWKTGSTLQRGKEIQEWLDLNPVENYVIIDDDDDMEPHQLQNFIQTSGNLDHPDCVDIGYGLTKICSERAIKILNQTI